VSVKRPHPPAIGIVKKPSARRQSVGPAPVGQGSKVTQAYLLDAAALELAAQSAGSQL
jgi:hypothetical protein